MKSLSINDFDNFEEVFLKIHFSETLKTVESISKPSIVFFKNTTDSFKKDFQYFIDEFLKEDYVLLEKKLLSPEVQELELNLGLNNNSHVHLFAKRLEKNEFLIKIKRAESNISFLSYMSHEIRVPIQSIIGISSLLKFDENFNPEQVDLINSLKFSSNNLIGLLNDILDFSKIQSGKLELNPTEMNLTELLGNLKNNYALLANEKNLLFEIKIAKNIEDKYFFDKLRLGQVLMNLINNAIKFTLFGFVKVQVKLISKEKHFSVLEFSIEDSGIGISKAKFSEIFDVYSRSSNTNSAEFKGTGLGLSISKKILRLMDSEIKLQSQEGIGTKFFFEIKMPHISTETEPAIPVTSIKNFGGKRVLLVEDNLHNQIIAKKLLQKLNLDITIAENGQIAFEKVCNDSFDLILMDLQMPILNGFDSARKIRSLESEKIKPTPIIALTATALSNTYDDVLAAGMNDYIPKPFVIEDLSQKIASFLSHNLIL